LQEGENVGCGFCVEGTEFGLTRGWQSLGRTKRLPVLHSTDVFTRAGLDCDSVLAMEYRYKSGQFLFPFNCIVRPGFNSHVQYCTENGLKVIFFHGQSTVQLHRNSVYVN
jgi:hypothetical protein